MLSLRTAIQMFQCSNLFIRCPYKSVQDPDAKQRLQEHVETNNKEKCGRRAGHVTRKTGRLGLMPPSQAILLLPLLAPPQASEPLHGGQRVEGPTLNLSMTTCITIRGAETPQSCRSRELLHLKVKN